MNNYISICMILAALIQGCQSNAQSSSRIARIEFNSGTRSFRQQTIITPDSVISIQEDFTVDKKPKVLRRAGTAKDWTAVLESLDKVRLTEIETLESPTMKRAYDGAAQGSIIITDTDGKTYTHGFDDENPNEKLQPLMKAINKARKK